MSASPIVRGIYLFVKDLAKSVAFYRALGFDVETVGPTFARTVGPNGAMLEFGTAELTRSYDPAWQPPGSPTKNTINLELDAAASVDATYVRLVNAGSIGHLAPCDAPWQARFAILEDPDGNYVGLHSPRRVEADRARERGSSG